ncbi:MAG: hypothetical protein KC466_20580, partial [Myxococcales bacterium]|nr:hypothetical protein [Myxococcales bacterium]
MNTGTMRTALVGFAGAIAMLGAGCGDVSKGAAASVSPLVVNGVTFDTTGARVTANGAKAAVADLKAGMVLTVRGSVDDAAGAGHAMSIEYDREIKGPIDSIDVAAGSLVVMGRAVLVDASTVFEHATLETLAAGDLVEVSGTENADGVLVATRIERRDGEDNGGGEAEDGFEVEGRVANLDPVAMTFTLGELTVDYSGAALRDLPGGALADGQAVEVKSASAPTGGVLVATTIEGKGDHDDFGPGFGRRAEIEGFVTRFVSAEDFDVAGQPVTTTADTVFKHGTVADLVENARLEVKGSLDGAGVLVATKVEFDDQGDDGAIGDDHGNDG